MKNKIIALLALFALTAMPAFASLQFSEAGSNEGQYKKVNLKDGVTIDKDGNIDFDDLVLSAPSGSITDFSATTGTITTGTITNFSSTTATMTSGTITNGNVTTSLIAPNTITAGSRTGALPLFVGGVQGSANKLFVATTTVANGGTISGATTVTGLTSAAKCFGTIGNFPTSPQVSVTTVTAGSGTVQATISGNPGASGATVNVICAEV